MSYEKCKSIGKVHKAEDGKWHCEIYAACNNVRPLCWRKVGFIPTDTKEEMLKYILHDLYNGNIHMQGKSRYQTFLDEVRNGVVSSPACDAISHAEKIEGAVWRISSANNHWHGQECKKAMDEKCNAIRRKCAERIDKAEYALVQEYLKWKPNDTKWKVRVNGHYLSSIRFGEYRTSWRYAWTEAEAKVFTLLEAKRIEKVLGEKYTVDMIRHENGNATNAA